MNACSSGEMLPFLLLHLLSIEILKQFFHFKNYRLYYFHIKLLASFFCLLAHFIVESLNGTPVIDKN